MQEFQPQVPQELQNQANAWVARFAPLVMSDGVPTEQDLRDRIRVCQELQSDGLKLKPKFEAIANLDDPVAETFAQALDQLDEIEKEVRRQLGRLKPGDPESVADLDSINEKLAERLARQEMGLEPGLEIPAMLELKVAPGNKAAGIGLGIFGLGWNSFTAVHATFMIGGFSQAFGWAALGLLGFYAIFFAVGIGMWIAAANAASAEYIELNGRELTVRKVLGPWTRIKKYKLGADTKAELGEMVMTQVSNNRSSSRPTPVVMLYDEEGQSIGIGATSSRSQQEATCNKINSYLAQQD